MNSTQAMHRRLLFVLLHLGFLTFFAGARASSGEAQDITGAREPMTEDRLSPAEEEFAYAAKRPAQRVAAFLRIADRKVEAAKRLRGREAYAAMAQTLCGYRSALQGASVAVAWGRDLGMDMQRQEAAIRRVLQKHAAILNKLEDSMPPESKPAILQARNALASVEMGRAVR
ncbi:MAG: hypothetical protein FJW26_15890 [Acidimicrobiia bacterium]|nr:hypothetical protein [Acidimicrobiia bacterium]